jgi:hypothetical protein
MESNEKTFRYSQIKSLGILYLMFLVMCVVAGLFVGIREFMFFGGLIGIGVILLILFLTSSVTISDLGITTKNLLGKKSLPWSEIRHVSSKGSSLKLHNRDGSTTLSINPRLDQSVEIFDVIYSKRPDLFSIKKNNPLVHNFSNNFFTLAIGLLLLALSLLLYLNKSYLEVVGGLVGLFFCARALFSWYTSPHKITLENDCLIVKYINRSYSISAGDVAAILVGKTKQNQFKSVEVIFRDANTMEISGFKQSPFIIYPVLSKWHQMYTKKEPAISS